MRYRWMPLVLLIAMLVAVMPVAAETRLIDPAQEPEITVSFPEAEKIVALQSTTFPVIASEVSPDDQAIFTVNYQPNGVALRFVNVNDSSVVEAQPIAQGLGPLSEIGWADARTIRYVSLTESFTPVLVDIDRLTGAVTLQPVGLLGFPISMSPDASRLLVAVSSESDSGESSLPLSSQELQRKTLSRGPFEITLQSPFDRPVKKSPFSTAWPGSPRVPHLFQDDQGDLNASSSSVQLVVQDLVTGSITPLLELPDNSILYSQPTWTPDGSKLAITRTTLPLIGRTGTPLSDITNQDALGQLPPDENPFLQGNVIDLFDFATGDLQPEALRAADLGNDLLAQAAWSPNGETLMVRMQRPGRLNDRPNPVYLFPDSSYLRFFDGSLAPLNTFDRPEISAPNASEARWISADDMVIRAISGLSYHLYYYNRVSGEFSRSSVEDGTYYQARPMRTRPGMVFNYSSFDKAPDIYRIQRDGNALAGLTYTNYNLRPETQIQVTTLTFTLRSGAQRQGYLVQPAGAGSPPNNAPLVVWQEGGPGGTMSNAWGSNVENPYSLLPNFGISVLVVPLAGREGWGPQFYNALAEGNNFGQIDIDEQAEIVQQLIDRGYTSAGRVGIAGCSYGGYFTSQSITQHPGLYAAANTQCTLMDLFVEWEFGFTPVLSYLEDGAPTTRGAEYAKDSPLYNAGKIRTPTLIFHGTDDFLPIQLVGNFHDQIDAQGVPVEFLQFEGEGHGLGAPSSQYVAAQRQIEWFRQYLDVPPLP